MTDTFGQEPQTFCPEPGVMPVVSVFYGIVVRMYYHDHEPPHFHAEYQDERATVTFDAEIAGGSITSVGARRRIREWTLAYRAELESNWLRAREGMSLQRIPPLL